ncbi:MAG: phosphotransferase enzyme family protein, partial [Saprospiraceae bacterium]|nr:phosphotransferase enzyme family protein [Saprospiraceae bacterium]
LQVLAVYGLRGLVEGKAHFLQSIPLALANLAWLLKDPVYPVEFPELRRHLQALIEHPRLVDAGRTAGEEAPLVVHIGSFSYRKGLPTDPYGHGGGFVFDCRAIHNPGRYEQYRKQTGLDPEVKAYLQQYTQMETFLREVFSLVDRAVDVYLDRDFEHLSVHFGCTGGQHRSVYAAERLARHLREKYGIRVEV